jgi:hypothetical protein
VSAADAFRTTLDLFDTGVALMRQTLRRAHPQAPEREIERRLRNRLGTAQAQSGATLKGAPVSLDDRGQ